MCRFLVPILIGVAAFVALAQQTQKAPPPPEISVEVKLVLISATVRDKDGTNVPGLNKDDFVLYVDGHLRAISNVIPQSDVPLTLGLLAQKPGAAPAVCAPQSKRRELWVPGSHAAGR